MKTKRVISVLCAAAVMLSSLTIGISSYSSAANTYAEEIPAEETEETKELAAPQNLRYEDGFIKWDKVEEAYGYTLRIRLNEGEYQEFTKYFDYDDPDDEAQVELDRLCYENDIDFGEYAFDVRIFDKAGNTSEWTDTVIAEFAPTLATPTNVRIDEYDEGFVRWDKVEVAYRYNIRIYRDDDERTLYYSTGSYWNYYQYDYWLEIGDYWISIQSMDKDYNVSEWTEPIKFSQTSDKYKKLKTPQNLRLDESGENIVWDEVEGAEYYVVTLEFIIGNRIVRATLYPEKARLDNWKSNVIPSPNGEYYIDVYAYAPLKSSDHSEQLSISYEPICDKAIELPEDLQLVDGYLQWNTINTAKAYYFFIWINDEIHTFNLFNNDCFYSNTYPSKSAGFDSLWNLDEYSNNLSYYVGNMFPEGNYEAELFVVDENGNYNSKTYSFTLDTPHDETAWVPTNVFYKYNTLIWERPGITQNYGYLFGWARLKNAEDDTVVMLDFTWYGNYYEFHDLPSGNYLIEVCFYDITGSNIFTGRLGPWSKPLNITVFDGSYFDEENKSTVEIEAPPEIEETIPEEDRITSITINPAFNMKHKDGDDVELDISKITIKAEEIYDEEGLKRVEEALGHEIKPNQKYNLLDLTLLYDGEDFSNGYEGLVQVIIPIPAGHRDKTFTVYRLIEVDGKTVKEVIPGEQTEDSYIIYLEHFSEYALIGESESEGDHTHIFGEEWKTDETNHWKECECGEKSEEAEHTYGDWTVTKEATANEEGSKERSCEICDYKQTEAIPALSHIHIFGEEWQTDETNHWKDCECGEKSEEAEHTYGDWIVTKEATANEEGSKERSCEICDYKQIETLPKLTPSAPSEIDRPIYIVDNTVNTGNTGNSDNTNKTDNTENTGNTGNTGNTNSTNNTSSTIGTDSSDNTNNAGNTGNTGGIDNTNNADKTDNPEPGASDDGNPSTGITAISTSIMVLSVCGAAIVLASKKRKTK